MRTVRAAAVVVALTAALVTGAAGLTAAQPDPDRGGIGLNIINIDLFGDRTTGN
ncbi:hypothetical protein [Streptomyces sp. NPDC006193]|uniref:hypothetical protein n=1 Tax=Streptomyces sp. NPDC006193 TaxID=3155717 RepID=UPI0033A1D0B1